MHFIGTKFIKCPHHLFLMTRPLFIFLQALSIAATLIFISGRGSTISSAKQGKSGYDRSDVKL